MFSGVFRTCEMVGEETIKLNQQKEQLDSLFTADPNIPGDQKRFHDDIATTYHHSMQHCNVTNLQGSDMPNSPGGGNYIRAPELILWTSRHLIKYWLVPSIPLSLEEVQPFEKLLSHFRGLIECLDKLSRTMQMRS
ncbi:hypothetical protein BCR34DRAFT_607513 [Clohesyomyces aquaticus]|uniref:Uncharacterized protein n=1 Tax=Clohesyomyces aquaticus TaxID=1231657 RepID=A0A1Y1YGC1_9PLEO|nr:hypothetical protein BCR34DRAFT_607513 [Clohesyomyces aquaticus]